LCEVSFTLSNGYFTHRRLFVKGALQNEYRSVLWETCQVCAPRFLAILPLYFRDPGNAGPLAKALELLALPLRTLQAVSARDEAYALPVDELRRLDVPTLIVAGRYDRFCPVGASRRLAQILPRARPLVFEESGHFPWLEEGERFYREAIP
jgi:pimeloyl-ACP methyl ester carboxylesterase